MKTIPVEVVGPTLKDRSPQLSNQMTMNMYLGKGRETTWAAYDFPGLKPLLEGAGVDRGQYVFNEQLYKVSGTTLLRVASDGSTTDIGDVLGTSMVIFADDGLNLVMASDGVVFVYNGTDVSEITTTNLETPNSVSYLNGFFLYDGDDGQFCASEAGDPTVIPDLSIGVANSNGDRIIRGYVHNQLVWWMGPRALEPWYFTGSGDLPFDRLEQGIVRRGLGAMYSVASNDEAIFFLGEDRQVYKLSGSNCQNITAGSAKAIENFGAVSDAIGWLFTFDTQEFYLLTFPAESKTMLYSITLNAWTNLSAGMHGERHYGNSGAFCYGKNYVADYRNGNLYELDKDTYTDNGDARLRYREMAPMTANQLGIPGHRLICGHLQLDMEVGVGLAVGQGVNPQIMCQFSGDGGKTYGPQAYCDIGVMGDYDSRVDFYQFVDGYTIVPKILCSDPVYLSIFGGSADVDDGGY